MSALLVYREDFKIPTQLSGYNAWAMMESFVHSWTHNNRINHFRGGVPSQKEGTRRGKGKSSGSASRNLGEVFSGLCKSLASA